MRFRLQNTDDGSLTVFDTQVGETYKSRHAARLEAEHVFYRPGILENRWLGSAKPFRVLELGFGLGTNCSFLATREHDLEFISIERDLAGLDFFLSQEKNPLLEELAEKRSLQKDNFRAQLIEGDFFDVLPQLPLESFHCVFFDPFSPKANPQAWSLELFRWAFALLVPEGRLVTYSVSRVAKDHAAAAGFHVQKHEPPPGLRKRQALLATKPAKH